MSDIARYDGYTSFSTSLNLLDDVSALLQGHSVAFLKDVLEKKHGCDDGGALELATEIEAFMRTAVGFLRQGLAGPQELSFLPLYYAILNLSKAYIVLAGQGDALRTNRWHGASRVPDESGSNLLQSKVKLRREGVLPLFNQVLTGRAWSFEERTVEMSELYPLIPSVEFELEHFLGVKSTVRPVDIRLLSPRGEPGVFYFKVFVRRTAPGNLRLEDLKAFFDLTLGEDGWPVSSRVNAESQSDAKISLKKLHVIPSLLYGRQVNLLSGGMPDVLTPLGGDDLLKPEELPLWLAFFHLADVVRYRPEVLQRYKTSAEWGVLLALSRHGILRFLMLFWSVLHESELVVV